MSYYLTSEDGMKIYEILKDMKALSDLHNKRMNAMQAQILALAKHAGLYEEEKPDIPPDPLDEIPGIKLFEGN